uniref:Uncharacterized protein n=1 Tax=Lygus hesperus TaxID=30085 RepID=A0A146KMX2_LYGHE
MHRVCERESTNVIFAWIYNNTNTGWQDEWVVAVDCLKHLERDVLTQRVLGEGFDATNNTHLTIGCNTTHISGVKSAVCVKCITCKLWLFVVAFEDKRPT